MPEVFDLYRIAHELQTQWGGDLEGDLLEWHQTGLTYWFAEQAVPVPFHPEWAGIQPMTVVQKGFAREAFELWDDLIALDIGEWSGTGSAHISFGYSSTTTQGRTYTSSELEDSVFGDSEEVRVLWLERAHVWASAGTPSLASANIAYGGSGFATYVHEIGHALGLSHPGSYDRSDSQSPTYADDAEYTQDTRQYTVMSYFDAGVDGSGAYHQGHRAATPLLHDIFAIQTKYGADMTTRTGNTTYGFNLSADLQGAGYRGAFDFSVNVHPVVAIWDAGGVDTLDVSLFMAPQVIDLNAGSFSNIGGLIGNVAIAYNCTIENAVGGSLDDYIIGNEVANRLEGRDGNDTLNGGLGKDLMIGGRGNDGYFVDADGSWVPDKLGGMGYVPGDQVIENANEGTDSVVATFSYRLPQHVENSDACRQRGSRRFRQRPRKQFVRQFRGQRAGRLRRRRRSRRQAGRGHHARRPRQ